MPTYHTSTARLADTDRDDGPGLGELLKSWIMDDSPSWLGSLVIHMFVFLVVGLVVGSCTIARHMVGDAPTFEAPPREFAIDEPVPQIDMGAASEEPSELDTDALDLSKKSGLPQREATYFDDDPVFESQGGGTAAGTDLGAGLGLNLKANGLGPVLSGSGGADAGKGEGIDFGKGGKGTGFGFRGKGHLEALLGGGGTRQTERAVAGALNWLARHQSPGGYWSLRKYTAQCKSAVCSGQGNVEADTGATALGLLPFLGAGQTHLSKGPYRKHIAKAVEWLLKTQKPDGDLTNNAQYAMYSQGLAAIALCEAYGMTGDPRVGHHARMAVQFIVNAQNQSGGWRYQPRTSDSDTSVYGWQMMALKSAMMAGMSVDQARLELGRKWLDSVSEGVQNLAMLGRFRYQANSPSSPTMSAVALLITQYTGARREDPVIVGGVKYLLENPPKDEARDIYYWYYATLVMHNMSGKEWDTWNRQMRRVLVQTQVRQGCASGSWDPDHPAPDAWGMAGGRLMLTALSALTLEVYYRYLPLFKVDEGLRHPAPPPGEVKKAPAEEKKPEGKPKDGAKG
jgi:hypothetical protein